MPWYWEIIKDVIIKTKYYGDFIIKKNHNYPMGKPIINKINYDKIIYHNKKLSELKHLSS